MKHIAMFASAQTEPALANIIYVELIFY